MRVLLAANLAFFGLGAPALAAGSGSCDGSSCQAETPSGFSLIQTKPSKHHKVSSPVGKRNHTDLAEERDEGEVTQNHEVSAHAGEHHTSSKDDRKREDSQHRKVSGHVVMNSTRSAHARKHRHTGLGKEDAKGNDSQDHMVSRHVFAEAAPAAGAPCTVTLFRDGVVDCKGVGQKVLTTTLSKGQETILPDNDWVSALVSGGCASVKFYDDDYESSKQDVQVDGGAGCVRFSYDLEDDMNGVMETALPSCTVALFRDGVIDCKGLAEKTIISSKDMAATLAKGDLIDNNWASALISGDCKSVEFQDDDWESSQQNVMVPGDAGCVRFEYDLENDMKGVSIILPKVVA